MLKELATPKADLGTVTKYITDDANAGRLKDAATGNTAYHMLVSGDHPVEFVMPVLELLLQRTPEGVKGVNLEGSCPLHVSLAQYDCELEVVFTLLRAYPAAAGVSNKQGLTPLFYCVMRDNPSPELVRAVCKVGPDAAARSPPPLPPHTHDPPTLLIPPLAPLPRHRRTHQAPPPRTSRTRCHCISRASASGPAARCSTRC